MTAPKFKAGDVVSVPRQADNTIQHAGTVSYTVRYGDSPEHLVLVAWLDKHGTLVEPVTVVDVLYLYVRHVTHEISTRDTPWTIRGGDYFTVTSYSDGTVRYEELPKDGAP